MNWNHIHYRSVLPKTNLRWPLFRLTQPSFSSVWQHEADVSRSEVKDVLQALEELAVTYEEKNNESKVLAKELEDLNGRLAGLQEKAEYHESEAAEIKERMTAMREKLHELIYDLNVQMANVGSEINKMLMVLFLPLLNC